MKHEIVKVQDPAYIEKWEMEEKYWGNFLLISNIKARENNSGMEGGIVRYYSRDNAKLYELIIEMDKDDDTYGSCMVKYMGDGEKNNVGGVFIR